MVDTTIFAWTGPTPPEGYPAYVNLKLADDGKCYITVRSRGNGGRDQACIEVSPQVLESLQCDLCEWLYREDVDRLISTPEAEVDAELRRLGIDPAEAERQGKAAVEGALETVRNAEKQSLRQQILTQIDRCSQLAYAAGHHFAQHGKHSPSSVMAKADADATLIRLIEKYAASGLPASSAAMSTEPRP